MKWRDNVHRYERLANVNFRISPNISNGAYTERRRSAVVALFSVTEKIACRSGPTDRVILFFLQSSSGWYGQKQDQKWPRNTS